jgi:hypothetical protein
MLKWCCGQPVEITTASECARECDPEECEGGTLMWSC